MAETPESAAVIPSGPIKRTHVTWSNWTDLIEGPCAVCGKEVRYLIPDDRPTPAVLFHSTCNIMPILREKLKTATPALLPSAYTIKGSKTPNA